MFVEQKRLPSVEEILERCPLSDDLKSVKRQLDEELKGNFIGRRKLTVVCGPCSADNFETMREYLRELQKMQAEHPDLLIAARIYTTKPHSNGQGYKGTCFHETVFDGVDLASGIIRARRIMIACLELGVPVADELLYTELYPYFADLVSYWFIGARSSENTLHRSFASGLEVCCGVKNGTDGDILKVIDSLNAISNPCVFPFNGSQIATDGCKFAHIVLRGGKLGDKFVANISSEHTRFAKECLHALGLNDFVMADLSHANSGKVASCQIDNARSIAQNPDVDGVMFESYLHDGVSDDSHGVSKTDECLALEETATVLGILEEGFRSR